MKQATETERQEQLDIVLRLNELTKQDVLMWKKHEKESPLPLNSEVYRTEWKGYSVFVEEVPTDVSNSGAGVIGRWAPGAYRLRVRQPTERTGHDAPALQEVSEDFIVIPPMPAIDDLVVTIKRARDKPGRAEGNLEDLRTFRKTLDRKMENEG